MSRAASSIPIPADRRLRVGDCPVICRIESPDLVLVVKLGHRKELCEQKRMRCAAIRDFDRCGVAIRSRAPWRMHA